MENKSNISTQINLEFEKYTSTIGISTNGTMRQLAWSAYTYGVGVGLQLAVNAVREAPPKGGIT